MREWTESVIDSEYKTAPTTEFVLVSMTALENLLQKGHPSVCFIDPEVQSRNITPPENCFITEDIGTELTESYVLNETINKTKVHAYWKLKLLCQISSVPHP